MVVSWKKFCVLEYKSTKLVSVRVGSSSGSSKSGILNSASQSIELSKKTPSESLSRPAPRLAKISTPLFEAVIDVGNTLSVAIGPEDERFVLSLSSSEWGVENGLRKAHLISCRLVV